MIITKIEVNDLIYYKTNCEICEKEIRAHTEESLINNFQLHYNYYHKNK